MSPTHSSCRVLPLALLILAGLQACSGKDETVGAQPGDPALQPDAATPVAPPTCPPDNPYCAGSDTPPVNTCGTLPIDLKPSGVNLMVAVDGSASMSKHWSHIQAALRDLRVSHPDAAIGIQVFWGEQVTDAAAGFSKSNWCGDTRNNVLEVGDHDEAALLGFLGTTPPGPSFVGGLFETSPVVEPLNYYLSNASKLADPARTNYLLFITDGNDNCFGSVFATSKDKQFAYQKLALELLKLGIRTLPIGFDAASSDSSGLFGTTPPKTNIEVLGALLTHGGTQLTEVPRADSPSQLQEVVAKVGQLVQSCRFTIPAALDPAAGVNTFQLTFSVAGKLVERDRLQQQGWNFVNGTTSDVEVFGQACEALRAGGALVAQKTCAENVCGSAAVKVQTRPRSVLLLLDSSASRIECADGTLNCLATADWNPNRTLTFWEVVEHAVSESLAAPINDDADFGLQFFPGKDAASLSCEVEGTPEVPTGPGTEITIMSKMLEKLPFGRTPLVQVLENVAASPGPLTVAGVLGSVVVLSDGGDNCSGASQGEIVERLGAAASSLHSAGVQTHVVRFGSQAGKSADQDAQLRAIVAAGGTASSDPADLSMTPYVDAKTSAELSAALAAISDRLSSCSFELGGLEPNIDRANANLYLNGEVLPFDSAASKQNGWSWLAGETPAIELFGEACQTFKNSRKTSVVVEFGCPPVTLL